MLWLALRTVFREPRYTAGVIILTPLLAISILLSYQIPLLIAYHDLPSITWLQEVLLAVTLIGASPFSLGWISVVGVLALSVLVSINAALLVYAWRRQRNRSWRSVFSTSSGGFLALLGVGCVACGPLLFGGIFAAVGATSLLLLLPFHGIELGVIALMLLLYATYSAAMVVASPLVCPIQPT